MSPTIEIGPLSESIRQCSFFSHTDLLVAIYNAPILWKASPGMSNSLHVSTVQPKKKSEITRGARETFNHFLEDLMEWLFKFFCGIKKGTRRSTDGQCSYGLLGRPMMEGNCSFNYMDLWVLGYVRDDRECIVMILILTPRFEAALSSNG